MRRWNRLLNGLARGETDLKGREEREHSTSNATPDEENKGPRMEKFNVKQTKDANCGEATTHVGMRLSEFYIGHNGLLA